MNTADTSKCHNLLDKLLTKKSTFYQNCSIPRPLSQSRDTSGDHRQVKRSIRNTSDIFFFQNITRQLLLTLIAISGHVPKSHHNITLQNQILNSGATNKQSKINKLTFKS